MTATLERPPHRAQFTPSILETFTGVLESWIRRGRRVLDPFGGRGDRLAEWCAGHRLIFTATELEVWANSIQADATRLPLRDACVDIGATSVTYANGLADEALNWADLSGRLTYDTMLGAPLHPNNTGRCGLRGKGDKGYARYLELHRAAYRELARVIKPGGVLALNCSAVVHKREIVDVSGDNVAAAIEAGFVVERWVTVGTPRYGRGANRELRAPAEDVVVLRRPKTLKPEIVLPFILRGVHQPQPFTP